MAEQRPNGGGKPRPPREQDSHAAGSGSTTGDPGKARGPSTTGGSTVPTTEVNPPKLPPSKTRH